MKRLIRFIFRLIIFLILTIIGLIIYSTIIDYQPAAIEVLERNDTGPVLDDSSEFSIMIWNIGYCGLNQEMDFFYDGGEQVRPLEKQVVMNRNTIGGFLKENEGIDFIMLQELDIESKRSYMVNQLDFFMHRLSGYHANFAKNYDVWYVPVPLKSPMGKVHSGIATLGRITPYISERHAFEGNFSWPMSIFMLDRCFLVNKYKVSNNKDLLIINTHNSAFDDGNLRKKQLEMLKTFAVQNYEKGNYVLIGGDWNQCPPGFEPGFDKKIFDTWDYMPIPEKFFPQEWKFAYDRKSPTNRRVNIPYHPDSTLVTVIDFYLSSPNLKNISVNTSNLKYEHADHNPVLARFKLN